MKVKKYETKYSNCSFFNCLNCKEKCNTKYTYTINFNNNISAKADLIFCENCFRELKINLDNLD